jgi:hypothetical protein
MPAWPSDPKSGTELSGQGRYGTANSTEQRHPRRRNSARPRLDRSAGDNPERWTVDVSLVIIFGSTSMTWVIILQKRPGKASLERGSFGFQQIPGRGDHVQIINDHGLIDLLQVEYVKHTPEHKTPHGSIEHPMTHVICNLLDEDIPLPPFGIG